MKNIFHSYPFPCGILVGIIIFFILNSAYNYFFDNSQKENVDIYDLKPDDIPDMSECYDEYGNGYIQDAHTAADIARIVWKYHYGEKIEEYTPIGCMLKDDSIWIIKGTQPYYGPDYILMGGEPYAEISKKDGRILKISFPP